MRLLFISWRDLANDQAGGSEQMVDNLARRLISRGHDVALLAGGPIERHDYDVMANGGELSQYLRAPIAYARHFRDRDLVVDVANGIPFFAGAWRDKPSVCMVHHIHTEQWAQRFSAPMAAVGRTLERRLMPRLYQDYIAVSSSTRDGLVRLGVDPAQIHLVPIGIELPVETLEPLPRSTEPLFLSLGRMVSHKRTELLFELWPSIHDQFGGRLVIAGDGPAAEALHRRARPPGLELVGRVTDDEKFELLAQAWALVHPAAWEGWGIVITEAGARGTPTVGFRVPGVQDAIEHDRTGLLAETDEAFAEHWCSLAADPDLRARLGAAAKVQAASYSWEATTDTFLEVAEATLRESRPTRSSTLGEPTLTRYHVVEQWAPDDAAPELSIIVPAYNEAQRLPGALPRLCEAVRDQNWEVLVVDDCSTDATVSLAADLLRGVARARVLQLDRHRGKGAAVRAGVADASGRLIMFMDADMATELSHLPELLDRLQRHDVVIGSRNAPGAVAVGLTPSRDNLGRLFRTLSRTAMGLQLTDFQCGFKGFRAPVARMAFHLLTEQGWAFDVEVLALLNALGADIDEMPVRWAEVQGSHIKILSDSARMMRDLARIGRQYGRGSSIYLLEMLDTELDGQLKASMAKLAPSALFAQVNQHVLVLLPFLDGAGADLVRSGLRGEFPDAAVRLRLLPVEELLAPKYHHERQSLLAAARSMP